MRADSLFRFYVEFRWSICFLALSLLGVLEPANLLRAQSVTFAGAQPTQVSFPAKQQSVSQWKSHPPSWSASTSVDFGSVALGHSSESIALHFRFHAPVQIGDVRVLTQGTEHLDFHASKASPGTACTAGLYTSGQSCTVDVAFRPVAPGIRMGAVVLSAATGKQILQVPMFGIGTGPMLTYAPASERPIASGFAMADGIAVDAASNIYISDAATNTIHKISPAGKTLQVLTGFHHPEGLAVNGAGDLYVADADQARIVVVPDEDGSLNIADEVVVGRAFASLKAIALDGKGGLYIADTAAHALYKLLLSSPPAPAVPQKILDIDSKEPVEIFLDSSGHLYLADQTSCSIVRIPSDGAHASVLPDASSCPPLHPAGGSAVRAATTDAEGNLFLIDGTGLVKEERYSSPPTLHFNATTSQTPQSIVLKNVGNLPLEFSGLSIAENFLQQASQSRDCNANTSLLPGSTCEIQLIWQPAPATFAQNSSSIFFGGSVSLMDNNLNQANQQQQIPLTANTAPAGALALHPNIQSSAAKLVFAPNQPPAAMQTGGLAGTVTVYVEDTAGNIAASPAYPVTLNVSGPGNYAYSNTLQSVNGVASFHIPETLAVAGTYTFQSSSSQLNVTLTPAATTEVVSGLSTTSSLVLSPANSVTAGSPVQLTATVKDANQNLVSSGIVQFYDGTTLLATAQLLGSGTTLGTASIEQRFAFGTHSLKAIFLPTNNDQASAASTQMLTVTGTAASTTTLNASTASPYTLTATVTASLPPSAALSGTVNLLDQSNANAMLGSATLGGTSTALSYVPVANPIANTAHYSYNQQNFIAVGDFNNDGIPDLAVADYSYTQITILLGNQDGTFTAQPAIALTNARPVSIVVGDFNRDGKQDLAVLMRNTGIIVILLGNGDGSFTAPSALQITTGMSTPLAMTAADFNGDGKLDLAVANYGANNVTVYLGNGDGSFTQTAPPYDTFAVGTEPVSIATADFNEDGRPDLVVANQSDGTLTVLLNLGNAHFLATAASPLTVGATPQFVLTGDWNHDGYNDLAVANAGSNTISLLLGDGAGSFSKTASSPIPVGMQPYSIASTDLNGDGNADLIIANRGSNNLTVLLGDGSGGFSAAPASPVAAGGQPVSVLAADLNTDGIPDIITANAADQSISVALGTLLQTATATANNIVISCSSSTNPHSVLGQFAGTANIAPSSSSAVSLPCTPSHVTPLINWPQPTQITYGTNLAGILNAAASYNNQPVAGTFSYSTSVNAVPVAINATTILPAGTTTLTATFTPSDSSQYNSATASVSITVSKASITVAAASASMQYGGALPVLSGTLTGG
ncbi:MAG: FG-GAP-like repeat-containing protein, partial [Acidobacteriaceae bacterium]